ncbi:transcriptional regulator [uncultured Microbulbifer sp.]|uniref:transcriptional regulator n=1 Tax=uncultured Microbulbifer sp. TaxID=348147 RepID=UPI002614CF13|nr:transcriptional regulator [uncultured Microbulbifer sp.]
MRLAICMMLAKYEEISFSRFKNQLQATDGHLVAQLRRLDERGYIARRKDFVERKPIACYHLTGAGREAQHKHLQPLQPLISSAS